jgi:hypothetical protein
MAKRSLGAFAGGFAVALFVAEALTPGTATKVAETSVNAGAPALQATGILVGEGLSATEPVAEGARDAVGGLGIDTAPEATEDTLPTTPLGG